MPAISVHARIEAHMDDDEGKALAKLTEYLVRGAYEPGQSLFLTAAVSGHMLIAACAVHAAAMRALRERNLAA